MATDNTQNANIGKDIISIGSQSVLTAILSAHTPTDDLVQFVQKNIMGALHLGKHAVPSHMGIYGNEQAGKIDTSSQEFEMTPFCFLYQNF